ADHTFGNQAFSCPILASQATADNMRACLLTYWHRDIIKKEMDEEPAMAEAWRDLKITLPTDAFDREKSFDFKGLSVILKKVGGHTNDSSIVFFPDFKTLFCGDIVFNRIYPTLLRHDGHPFKLIEVLKGLLVMDIDTIVPGHGAVGDKSIVEKSIDYWVCLTGKIRQHIDDHLDDKRIREKILGECRLGGIPFNKRRHQKNVDSVIFFLRKQLNAACSRTQAI
ncbi:MAG: MBL fold metallo-hydrolase, partial [Candidatus Zixiibacteriota bacterium]